MKNDKKDYSDQSVMCV